MYIPIKLYFYIYLITLPLYFQPFFIFISILSLYYFSKNAAAISHRCSSCFYHEIILFLCRCRLDDMISAIFPLYIFIFGNHSLLFLSSNSSPLIKEFIDFLILQIDHVLACPSVPLQFHFWKVIFQHKKK